MARKPAIAAYPRCSGSFIAENAVLQYAAVIPGTDDHQIKVMTSGQTTAGEPVLGIVQNDANANDSVEVVFLGPSLVHAGTSVTVLNALGAVYNATAAKNGEVEAITTLANTYMIVGVALEDAADTEFFWANIVMQYQLATS